MLRLHTLCAGLLAVSTALAGDRAPEIQRAPATPQAVGVVHTLRTIPEACTRLEGRFTGNAGAPYALAAVRTGARCQPRSALRQDAPAAGAAGWVLNDLIRVPSARPASAAVPRMDAQGKARVYLKEGLDAAAAGQLGAIPQYAMAMAMEGKDCR
ncbi:MAG: hypothetical protein ABS98_17665 [Lysobacteraceae bacterium SCN 69-48]|nr:MAG: hypothetical protein ABS98_17665 [Xanthomonadaceae bacterium SCN 69-48]